MLTGNSHHPTVEAHDTTAMTSLRLLAVLDVLSSTTARAKRLAPFSSARLAPRPGGPLTHFASPCGEKCRLFPVDPRRPDWGKVRRIASAIRRGAVVAMPTDTVYGLAANPYDSKAVRRLFRLKRRPETKPILLLIDGWRRLAPLVSTFPPRFEEIASRFWPGPLTVILPASKSVPELITAGTGNVAVRCPGSPLIRMLSRSLRYPLTGTSANLSGLAAATTAKEVIRQFGTRLCYVVDGGRSADRQVSTIVDLSGEPCVIRSGAIPIEQLDAYLR